MLACSYLLFKAYLFFRHPFYLCSMNDRTVAFHHFGCKVNFAEGSTLSRQFKEKGWSLIDFHEKADLYVINTCAVTGIAEKKCRAAIRQAHRLNPEAKIAVIGCLPELKPGIPVGMEGVDIVLGHTDKFRLPEAVDNLTNPVYPIPRGLKEKMTREPFIPSFSYGDRTRSFLKIQDGCDYHCAYCTIPLARGNSRSDTIANVVTNAEKIAANGVKEIVLTGVNIGDFGKQNGENLFNLIQRLEAMERIPRIRISSIEPDLLTDEIVELVATSKKLMPHFHIPLQSGSDKTLKAMHRKYSREYYEKRIHKIRSVLPLACIAADIIIGFPGESDNDFRDTLNFLITLPVSYLHVFSYSKRENTPASLSKEQIHDVVKKERSNRLHQLSEEKKHSFYMQNMGRYGHVLWESDNSEGTMSGFTENYIHVKTTYTPAWVNQIMVVKLDRITVDGFFLPGIEPLKEPIEK